MEKEFDAVICLVEALKPRTQRDAAKAVVRHLRVLLEHGVLDGDEKAAFCDFAVDSDGEKKRAQRG